MFLHHRIYLLDQDHGGKSTAKLTESHILVSQKRNQSKKNSALIFFAGEQQTLSTKKVIFPITLQRRTQEEDTFFCPQMRNLFSNVAAHTHNILHNIYIFFSIIFILQVKQLTKKWTRVEGEKQEKKSYCNRKLNWQNLYAHMRYMVHNNACGKYINMEIVKWSLLLIGKLYSSVLWCTVFFSFSVKVKRTTKGK